MHDALAAPAVPATVAPARPRARDVARVGLLAAACVAVAVATKDLVAVVALASLAVLAWRARRWRRGVVLLGGEGVAAASAIAVLGVAAGGVDIGAMAPTWRPQLAMLAYPFLARLVLRLAAGCRRFRDADVLVEGALVGLAAGIVVQVVVGDWRAAPLTSALEDASAATPSVLVGLDVALLVVGARALWVPAGRRGPAAVGVGAVVVLLAAHLVQALDLTGVTGGLASALVAVAVGALGLAAVHPSASTEPELVSEEPPLFSPSHAVVVIVALVAAPVVLAVQAIRQITVTATVATGAVVSGAVLAGYLVTLLRERAATEHRATHDALTALPNRVLFADRLDRAIAHARRNDLPLAVLFVDLDGFKAVNDTLGHAAGDVLLREVATRLLGCCREEDTVARLSGDEFAVLLPHPTADGDAVVVAQRILDAMSVPVTVAGERIHVGASVGIAVFPDDGATSDVLLVSADAAMYRAKEEGGAGFELFNVSLATEAHERLRLEASLHDGMDRGELLLHFQPIIDVATGRAAGAEALVRWQHRDRGLLLPGHFVPVAERSDLVVRLGEQVVLAACEELRRWDDLGLGDRWMSVNVSARHFTHGLASTVASTLRDTGADPARLIIELTESTAADNLDAVVAALEELRSMGVRSAIDDFGTGWCGLRYLGSLPVDALKIDRSFVQGMTATDAAIVAATVAMGHSLGLEVVAEGVETEEQRRFLERQRCDYLQGFLLGMPVSATEIVDRFRAEPPLPPASPRTTSTTAGSEAVFAG